VEMLDEPGKAKVSKSAEELAKALERLGGLEMPLIRVDERAIGPKTLGMRWIQT
jgi:hypothetical protein